jgi:hypothetical protein
LGNVSRLRGMDAQRLLRPNPHTSSATAHRAAPLKAGARSMGRGLRVGVTDSLGGGFVGHIIFGPFSYLTHLFNVIGDVGFLDAMGVEE